MDPGLLWTIIGSGAGVIALGVGGWQVRLQMLEREDRKVRMLAERDSSAIAGLPVAAPFGRLPVQVRGRADILHELKSVVDRRYLLPGSTWILAGMGGVGKSTVALAVAEAAKKEGWQVWWVTALNSASLAGGMVEILHQLEAPQSVIHAVNDGAPTAPARAWNFLNGRLPVGRRWLLVFDNADDPHVLAPGSSIPADYTGWLRYDPTGILIVTSRIVDTRVWGSRIKLRILPPLEISAAAHVLTDLAPGISDPTGGQASDLARRLGGLPLALHLAGSYLASPFTLWHSFSDYREELDSRAFPRALAELDENASDARDAIHRTWEISLQGLEADGRRQARPLLELLSAYAPVTPIPRSVLDVARLHALFSDVGIEFEPRIGSDDPRPIREALSGLRSTGLIQIDSSAINSDNIIVHPVVADVNRSQLLDGPDAVRLTIGRAATELLYRYTTRLDPMRVQDWPSWQKISPHIAAILEWLAPYVEDVSIVNLLDAGNPAVEALYRCGDLVGAENLARLCVTAAVRLPSDEPATLLAQYELATAIAFQGRYAWGEYVDDERSGVVNIKMDPHMKIRLMALFEEADRILHEVLARQQSAMGSTHPDTLRTRYRLAWVLGLEGQVTESEQMFRRVLEDSRRALGDDDISVTAIRHRIGWALALQRKYAEAEMVFRELLPDHERTLGADHPDTLSTRHRMAWVVGLQGRFSEAEQMHRSLLSDEKHVLGDDHPDTLTTRQRLAQAVAHQGRRMEAVKMFIELLPQQQRVLGRDHPETLTSEAYLERNHSRFESLKLLKLFGGIRERGL